MAEKQQTAPSPRRVAAESFMRVVFDGGYSNIVIDTNLKRSGLSGRDASFASALFYLAVERHITLRHCVAAHCPHKLSKPVTAILETAMAQLLYMDVPPSAAVNEAVTLTRAMGQARSAGLVNGVLRSFIRSGCAMPPVAGDHYDRMAVDYACDPTLVRALCDWCGEGAARAVLENALGRAPVFLRVNPLKADADSLLGSLEAEGVTAAAGPLPGSLVVTAGDVAATQAYRDGLFHVQDLSSQTAVETLGARPDERILDVCAAPGGKSFTMAYSMADRGEVVSCDLSENRLSLIRSGAERLGLRSVCARRNDGAVLSADLGMFDRILCDVPCSGVGVIRRKPELKWQNPQNFADLPELQYKILCTSSNYLKAGGTLLYTTCTLNPAENMGVAGRFLEENPDFAPLLIHDHAPMRTFLPIDPLGGDGFFIAAFRRGGACR